jgi:hypothetical protein
MKTALRLLAGAAALATTLIGPAGAQGHWKASDLFAFDGASGYSPNAGVIAGLDGVVYGTTSIGGTGPCLAGAGCGTVYGLAPPAAPGGAWRLQVLYDFQGGQDGYAPAAPLAQAPDGTLYGYTAGGTPGSVFRLRPPVERGGVWTFELLHVFAGTEGNLLEVHAPLVVRDDGVYGIASGGSLACGQVGCGSAFRLAPPAHGGDWTFTTLFRFTGDATSGRPTWVVGATARGPLFVSTGLGEGAVVALAPPAGRGPWMESFIAGFTGGAGGHSPSALVLAADGTLHGIALRGGTGFVFEIRPGGTLTDIATVLFHRSGPSSLAAGPDGTLVGAIEGDFDFFAGSVFQLTPPPGGIGAWMVEELWNFNRGPDRNPLNVVTGRGGNLFGVLEGGDSTNGSLFELRHPR